MIDIRKLKELVRLMVAHDLTEVDLRDSKEQVTLRRQGIQQPPQIVTTTHAATHVATRHDHDGHAGSRAAAATAAPPAPTDAALESLAKIQSPMVGTFYSAPDPDAPPFVSVGSRVGPDTVVCLIEAMKIFNEIKAECSGTVYKVLVSSATAVEFGQPLFLVKPD